MNEMIERVAIAIALTTYTQAADEIAKMGIKAFSDIVEENFVEAARAAIEAIHAHLRETADGYDMCQECAVSKVIDAVLEIKGNQNG